MIIVKSGMKSSASVDSSLNCGCGCLDRYILNEAKAWGIENGACGCGCFGIFLAEYTGEGGFFLMP